MRIRSYSDVLEILGISRVTLWRWLRDDGSNFPRPVCLGKRKLGFVQSELDAWIAGNRRS
ncbi:MULTISPECIES: helix-turn-helix transcriptional regulator [unclassified Janthinobacterium]|uniref:helix-turn-helix transcriptional regulator n=1 Tax=unclassified Janthinobacterium TaxID=2610881 RepID=UPI000A31F571|nr:AlpA family phage regulatory protein [Janthinobacterium sp. GW458P]QYG04824.1 AlpA family phage regulatory protein [Janthinobacterium sp. PAMC25594]